MPKTDFALTSPGRRVSLRPRKFIDHSLLNDLPPEILCLVDSNSIENSENVDQELLSDDEYVPESKKVKSEPDLKPSFKPQTGVPRAKRGKPRKFSSITNRSNTSYGNVINQKEIPKTPDRSPTKPVRVLSVDKSLICNICQETLNGFSSARFHYSIHYYEEKAFEEHIAKKEANDQKTDIDHHGQSKLYSCSDENCTRRKMGFREFCLHQSITHQLLKMLMKNDKRQGMGLTHDLLYSSSGSKINEKDSETAPSKANVSYGISRVTAAASETFPKTTVVKDYDNSEDIDDPVVEANSERSCRVVNRIKKEHSSFNMLESSTTINSSRVSDSTPQKTAVERNIKTENDMAHRSNKPHVCLVCRAPSKSVKDGRKLNLGSGINDTKYHYTICAYNEGGLMPFIDPGQGTRQKFEELEEYGNKFRYKCPFTNCNKNVGRTKPLGYKEYAIHCGVFHDQVEKWMMNDHREGIRDVYEAVRDNRIAKGGKLLEMPAVIVEEVHTCILCKGFERDGNNLIFSGDSAFSARYHYASCFYNEGVYFEKYPPGPENSSSDGKPLDALGKEVKYSCKEKRCTVKRKMGYKEFAIHMGNAHGGVIDVMREDSRPELQAIANRLPR